MMAETITWFVFSSVIVFLINRLLGFLSTTDEAALGKLASCVGGGRRSQDLLGD